MAKIFHDCVEFFGDYPQNFIDTDHDLQYVCNVRKAIIDDVGGT